MSKDEWIKCSDRMPTTEYVLVYIVGIESIKVLRMRKSVYSNDIVWVHDDSDFEYELNEVKYWMPLPLPPKEEKEDVDR